MTVFPYKIRFFPVFSPKFYLMRRVCVMIIYKRTLKSERFCVFFNDIALLKKLLNQRAKRIKLNLKRKRRINYKALIHKKRRMNFGFEDVEKIYLKKNYRLIKSNIKLVCLKKNFLDRKNTIKKFVLRRNKASKFRY